MGQTAAIGAQTSERFVGIPFSGYKANLTRFDMRQRPEAVILQFEDPIRMVKRRMETREGI